MKNKSFPYAIIFVLLFGFEAKTQSEKRPNIVLILADDISRNDFGCYGNTQVKTPNIDALAKQGIKFNNTFLTISSCSPSRSSIMTGRYPHNTGAAELHSPIGEEQVFFPCLLKEAGYYTAQAGKWHIGGDSTEPNGPALPCFDKAGGSRRDGGGRSGAKQWVPYLKERPKDQPFFMWFASHDAHRDFWDQDSLPHVYNPDNIIPPVFFVNDAVTRKDLAGYYNEITRFDHYVGEVVKELKVQGVFDNTVIIVMADNGRDFPRAKTLLLEDGIMTPFIVSFPNGIKQKGSVSRSLLSIIDLAPTLIELADAQPSETFQGRSFTKLLANPDQKFRQYVFAEHNWHVKEAYERMIATEDHLLVENKRPDLPNSGTSGSPTWRSLNEHYKNGSLNDIQQALFITPRDSVSLYDRKKDPDQVNNIARENPSLTNSLLKVLRQWQDETGDTVPKYLKPNRSEKKVDYLHLVEMPGESKNAKTINKSGPF